MAKKRNGSSLLALGAVGVAALALMRSGVVAQVLGSDPAQAAEGAGHGGILPQQQQGLGSRSASADALPVQTTSHSIYWGRDVRSPLAVGGFGSKMTAADSEGMTIILTSRGLEDSTRSSLWLTKAGVQRIPWDTNPLSYFWDGGRPHGGDAGAMTPSRSGGDVGDFLYSVVTFGASDLVREVAPKQHEQAKRITLGGLLPGWMGGLW